MQNWKTTYIEGFSRIVVEINVVDLVGLVIVSCDNNIAKEDPSDVPLQVTFGGHLELIVAGIRPEHLGAELTAQHHVTLLLFDGGNVPRPQFQVVFSQQACCCWIVVISSKLRETQFIHTGAQQNVHKLYVVEVRGHNFTDKTDSHIDHLIRILERWNSTINFPEKLKNKQIQ